MTFAFDDPGIMRRLLRDLEELEAGKLDTADILAKAPLLEDHRLALGWCHAMKGIEPPRLCRRPQLVRSRVYDKQNDEQIFS